MTVSVNERRERVRLLVRQRDPARYTCSLFAPADKRQQLFGLIAFHHELAQAVDRVSEPMLAHIRLAWWREVLTEIAGGECRRHDVVESLAALLKANSGVASSALSAMIDARGDEVEATQPADIEAYTKAASLPAEALAAAMLDCLQVSAPEARQAALAAATAWAMAGQLQSLGFHAQYAEMVLPSDVMARHDLTPQEIIGGTDSDPLRAAVAEVLAAAAPWMTKARGHGRQARAVGYLAIMAGRLQKRFQAAGHNPFDGRLIAPDTGALFALSWRAWTGR